MRENIHMHDVFSLPPIAFPGVFLPGSGTAGHQSSTIFTPGPRCDTTSNCRTISQPCHDTRYQSPRTCSSRRLSLTLPKVPSPLIGVTFTITP